jgi:hypothetical protein
MFVRSPAGPLFGKLCDESNAAVLDSVLDALLVFADRAPESSNVTSVAAEVAILS